MYPKTSKTNLKRIEIDFNVVDELLEAGCNGVQVAAYLGIYSDTLYDRVMEKFGTTFSTYQASKRSHGDAKLYKAQFDKALGNKKAKGDNTMLIFLGKNRLKQKDTPDQDNASDEAVRAAESLNQQITQMQEQVKASSEQETPPQQESSTTQE